jgi:hypothetical protein
MFLVWSAGTARANPPDRLLAAVSAHTVALLKAASSRYQSIPSIRYVDGRSACRWRLPAQDEGVVFPYGKGPNDCDYLGCREAVLVEEAGMYHLFYDGCGPKGWLACLAVSRDLRNWERLGPVLEFGAPGDPDARSASAPWMIQDDKRVWHMFYLGTPNATPGPDFVPMFPYLTLKAQSSSLRGPWIKQREVRPFDVKPGTFRESTASPGAIIRHDGGYLQFYSGSISTEPDRSPTPGVPDLPEAKAARRRGGPYALRTLGLARTRDLNASWQVEDTPLLPLNEQIENSSLYYEKSIGMWFLFTNHIGCTPDPDKPRCQEFTDSIWVYWSRDPTRWNPDDKAVVLDGENCTWSKRCIGMPTVRPVGNRLAMLYDAPGGDSTDHMRRSIGLAWLDLPIGIPGGI